MKEIYLFPVLNEENATEYGLKIGDFKLEHNGQELTFNEKDVLIKEGDTTWSAQNKGLTIKINCEIERLHKIYGKGGVACNGAQVGFYLIWSNLNTLQSGCEKLIKLDNGRFYLEKTFQPETITGKLNLFLHAFIEKASNFVAEEEKHLLNEQGVSLGVVKEETIILDKGILKFPIFEVEEEDRPLWWVDLKWDRPEEDRFDNSVTVFLNKKFKSYPKDVKGAEFLNTIIATVYYLIFKKLAEQNEDVFDGIFGEDTSFNEYSVCRFAQVFHRKCSFLNKDDIKTMDDEKLMAIFQKEINRICGGISV